MGVPANFGQQQWVLELDGRIAGSLHRVDNTGSFGNGAGKQGMISRPESFTIEFGSGMSSGLHQWIQDTLLRKYHWRSGALVTFVAGLQTVTRLEFSEALIEKIKIPELRSTVKAGYISLDIRAERHGIKYTQGKAGLGGHGGAFALQTGSFRVSIDGLEKECSHITGVARIAMKQGIAVKDVGQGRFPELTPNGSDTSSVVLSLPRSHAAGFGDWLSSATVGRTMGTRNGSIRLAPASGNIAPKLELHDLSIMGFSVANTGDARVELTCGRIGYSAGSN